VPAPESIKDDKSRRAKEGIRSQKDKLFIRGKAISTHPNIMGISQLPKPPMAMGITMKKIIMKA